MKKAATVFLVLIILGGLFATYRYGQDRSLVDFRDAFLGWFPKLLTAFLIFLLARLLLQIARPVLARFLQKLEQRRQILSMISLVVHAIALLAALSVLVGSVSSFIASLGLVGLGLTFALQTPILCFTGWILITVKRHYREGDRIRVNDIYGDVTEISFLTTTVWEYGSTWFTAEQPSGRLITLPNSMVLQTAVYNYTRDFPYIWDEVRISMAFESDLSHTRQVVLDAARTVLGDSMILPIRRYREILKESNLDHRISEAPEIFLTFEDSWVNLHLRYLVPARGRRPIRTAILENIFEDFSRPENADRIKPIYPRTQIQRIDGAGAPMD